MHTTTRLAEEGENSGGNTVCFTADVPDVSRPDAQVSEEVTSVLGNTYITLVENS